MAEPIKCRLGLHSWQEKYDHRKALAYRCRECGKRMGTGRGLRLVTDRPPVDGASLLGPLAERC